MPICFEGYPQEGNSSYAVDSIANAWVVSHTDEIRQMTPQKWCEIEFNLAQHIYSNFSPEQEFSLWKYKFDETLQLHWTPSERKHIVIALKFLEDNRDVFFESPLSENSKDKLAKFEKEWIEYAIKELGWTKFLCNSIIASPYPLKSTDGTLRIP